MAYTASEIQQQVKDFIITNFFLDPETTTLEESTSFLDEGIIDSTGILEVIGFVEETYGVKVKDSEMLPENLDSLGNIGRFVTTKLSR